MGDRVSSDNPAVRSLRGRLVRRGGTHRPAVELPPADREHLPAEGTVRLVVAGRERSAPVGRLGDSRGFLGAFDNARLARDREGPDRLAGWVEMSDLDMGRSVLIDVVEPGEVYGLRRPGEEAVYAAEAGPAASLKRIAEDLDP